MFHPDNELHRKEFVVASIHKAIVDDNDRVDSITIDSLPQLIQKRNKRFLEQFYKEHPLERFLEQYNIKHPSVGTFEGESGVDNNILTDLSDFIIPKKFIKILLNSKPYDQLLEGAAKNSKGGFIAGDILLYLFRQKKIGINPSLRKARFLFEKNQQDKENRSFSIKYKISYPYKRKWKLFKPVSHLWASLKYILILNKQANNCLLGGENYAYIFEGEIFQQFLAIAEYFRAFGEGIISEKVKKPIFEKDEMWRVPANYLLPPVTPNLFDSNIIKDSWLEKTLKGYKATTG
jgi:hypothetical protein